MSSVIPDPATTDWVPLGYGAQVQASVPSVHVYRDVNVSGIANTASYMVVHNQKLFDTDNMWSATVNPTRLTCRTAGKYQIGASAHVYNGAGGVAYYDLNVLKNGGSIALARGSIMTNAGTQMLAETIVDLLVGDYIEMSIANQSGAATTLYSQARFSPDLWMTYLGPGFVSPIQGIPQPVVNGQWIKGVGGSAVWAPIVPADIGAVGYAGGTALKVAVGSGTYSVGAGDVTVTVNLPTPWPIAQHFFTTTFWPASHWAIYIKGQMPSGLGAGSIMFSNGSSAQNVNIFWLSVGT
jgi:hypothetical protein